MEAMDQNHKNDSSIDFWIIHVTKIVLDRWIVTPIKYVMHFRRLMSIKLVHLPYEAQMSDFFS